ncbi:hypothetical protein I3760_14G123800 [Carya illinoinensis]|nr:hypothetical protein I3760_14G123800 [Carya illinoinensis]KAG2671227.1 hypothetical protein I3760_14G123800 [Carya illinoinensis]
MKTIPFFFREVNHTASHCVPLVKTRSGFGSICTLGPPVGSWWQDPSLERHRVGPVNLRNLYFARFAQEQHKLRWRPWPGFLCKEIILISVLLLPWLLFGWKSSSIRPFPLL